MGSVGRDPEFARRIRLQVESLAKRTIYHTLEVGDGHTIAGLIPVDALRKRLDAFPVPPDLRGKRVLDVGAASGWNSFEMERRGAEVVAVDCVAYEELPVAKQALGSGVDYRILDVDEITSDTVGRFDYVLFFGVLYHLRHPLLGLERICAVTREAAFVESFVVTDQDSCTLEFYEVDELGGQIDNWYGPTVPALTALCRSAGFARVRLEYVDDRRAGVTCYRTWEPAPAEPSAPAPWLCSAVNNRTLESTFHPGKDEYICLYFRYEHSLPRDKLRVEVDGLGVPALILSKVGENDWQANLTTPPGLEVGDHEIRLRTVDSAFSRSLTIHVADGRAAAAAPVALFPDPESAPNTAPVWVAVENCADHTRVFRGYKTEHLCCYFVVDEESLEREEILVEVDGEPQAVLVLSNLGDRQWQTNSRLRAGLSPGKHAVRLRTATSRYSDVREIEFQPETD